MQEHGNNSSTSSTKPNQSDSHIQICPVLRQRRQHMDQTSHEVPRMASRESNDETNGGAANTIDTPTYDVESDGSSTKKRKLLHAPFRQRKRAATACQFCRLRKTKCDNARPVCGFCRYHRAKCVYSDTVTVPEEEGAVLSEWSDMQHNQLLSRLDRIEELLRLPQENNNSFCAKRGEPRQLTEASAVSSLPTNKTKIFFFPSTRSEAPLKWPIFNGFLDERYTRVNSFILEPPLPETCDTPRSVFTSSSVSSSSVHRHDRAREGAAIGIRDEALVPLCRKFLTDVHIKNPILEGSQLIAYAIDCVEHGLKWDAPSCLVLLACALACYTDPWTPPESVRLPAPDAEIPKGADAAAVYWIAAKKRIGLLESSLVDIQCLFFASVYERSAFRSLNSWLYLQQAATRLHIYHLQSGGVYQDADEPSVDPDGYNSQHGLQERIFWSIFKAESDMLPELQLTPTDLQQFDYPSGILSPPESLSLHSQTNDSLSSGSLTRHDEERSWFFYLAELSIRRTINDVLLTFYEKGEWQWVEGIDLVCRQFDESDKQMSLWTSCLPLPIQFSNPQQQPSHELVHYLQGRLEEWRELIHRPFLYFYLHHPPNIPPTPRILNLARVEVQICADLIGRVIYHGRHGGTWLLARRSWRCAIIILAVVIRDGEVKPPQNWRELVRTSLRTLARWSPESPDL